MATRYIGVDTFSDWTLPSGRITLFATSAARDTAGYTDSATQQIDQDDSAAAWDADIETGWFHFGGAYSKLPPRTALRELKDETNITLDQFDAWDVLLDELAHGYDPTLVQTGHDFLWRARGGLYLLLSDSNRSTAAKLAIVKAARLGALDITSVPAFYTSFEGDPGATVSDWLIWVDPSDASRVNLLASTIVSGTVPGDVALYARQWVEALI